MNRLSESCRVRIRRIGQLDINCPNGLLLLTHFSITRISEFEMDERPDRSPDNESTSPMIVPTPDRQRNPNSVFVAWRTPNPQGDWRVIGRLEFIHDRYRFRYTQGAIQPEFSPFPQMSELERVYESEELFPIFAERLLLSSRMNFGGFLRSGPAPFSHIPYPLVTFGRTEGLWSRDVLELFPCPQPISPGEYVNHFFLHGIRWMSDSAIQIIPEIEVGEELKLMPDPQNDADPRAVAVRTEIERMLIGYVPRYFAPEVSFILNSTDASSVHLVTVRIAADAPFENRVLCRLSAPWPDQFQPCNGDDFEPIATFDSSVGQDDAFLK